MGTYDLVIRGGTVADGTGGDLFEADIAVSGGKIAEIGKVAGKGAEEIDASGLLVTPGFVDIHTHYDGQATWSADLSPSSNHGVTTAVMGNCGVGFAPCRREDHDRLIRLMEGVEDIPAPVLAEGLKWNWESFPDYLDALEALPHNIDFAAQLPHGALRVYVMGERGANREPATPDDIAAMAAIAKDAVSAGAIGFSTSRTLNHRTSDGSPTPTLTAEEDELVGIAMGLKAAGRGVLQVVSDFADPAREFSMLRRMVERSGRPLSLSLAQNEKAPEGWRFLLSQIEAAANDGLPMKAQVCGRPVGVLLGLELTLNPFSAHPGFKEIASLPLAAKVEKMRDPAFKEKLLKEEPATDNPFMRSVLAHLHKMYALDHVPDYEPDPETSIGARAKARGVEPLALAYDLLLEDDGRAMLYFPFLNYAQNSLEPSYQMMLHKDTVLGLGDGGAHVGMICDGSFSTHMLTHWTRDRKRGERLPLSFVVKAHTQDTARAVGLLDRGILKPGYKADLNVIDYQGLSLFRPEVGFDLPAGGRRLVQRAKGYKATIVSGEIIARDDEGTGAVPGKLLRGAQPAPA
ncbi:amidohydrolase family protein/D-aminoacylase domain-containing protein [Tepidicaulis marinus]|uniref:Amidohydrolase family protein/D-aminoacylase domain-containing protein n=1 Tax=Tepidicaulis marinus TaxID=1333998 RepID=A0A081B765_9HYPH|nr:amidohydrolase family protein [Tepidicaulis marinus]GAK43883.1 amidohydrolase family protein/D-aminoacylase domain-containing protein [Tepidicaulis marinus]